LDLYTTSRRLASTFTVDPQRREALPIADHGLIGDGLTCALVGVDGSIDWLCWPQFDSPSVFAGILDPERGGCCRIGPTGACESRQAYDDATAVLQTQFHRPGEGTVVLTDFMPWTDDRHSAVHEVHRLIEARDGALEMEIVFDPRFDYGSAPVRLEPDEHGIEAEGPLGQRLALSVPKHVTFERRPEGGMVARFPLQRGQRLWAVLSWRSKRAEPVEAFRPFEQLRRTRGFWRRFSSRLTYDGPWRHDVLRSAITLKLLQFAPTGAVVAAPTTSLPAWLGGSRNWDYRFSWTRDSAMAIRAMNLIGYHDEALGFFHFVRECVDRRGGLDIMVSIEGEDVADEQVLDHLSGHAGSRPVRIGNAAAHQLQHDIFGPLLDAALLYERVGGMVTLRVWREIRHLVDEAIATIDQPDQGIWEPRSEAEHHVHSKLMAWVAIDRALQLAGLFGGDREQATWLAARDSLHAEIVARAYNERTRTFVGTYDGDSVDATLLLMPVYGFLPLDDPRIHRTIDRVIDELSDGPYLRRYRNHDGIDCDEGGFVLCGFWLAEALALTGRLDRALEVFHAHSGTANHLGLIAEEVDPRSGALLGNFPQAFSHLGMVQAAARLDLALRLRDEGAERPPHHAIDFPGDRRGRPRP